MINTTTTTNSNNNNNNNHPQSSSSPGGLKTYFKTPEGRYKLHNDKTHPSGLLHYAHGKTLTQVQLPLFLSRVLPQFLETKNKNKIHIVRYSYYIVLWVVA